MVARPRVPSTEGAVPPAPIPIEDVDSMVVSLSTVCASTRMDKKTILAAIHAGKLPAFFAGGNPQVGWRFHRHDVEAWYFNDPAKAHTPGTGSPEGPRRG